MSKCECDRPEGQCIKGDLNHCPAWEDDECDAEEEYDFGEECGRWDNGRLGRYCSKAGSEECDWECPYSR